VQPSDKSLHLIYSELEGSPMNLSIEIPDDLAAALAAQAEAEGLTTALYARRVIERTIAPVASEERPGKPLETGYGMWAKHGSAPSAEEIDENRREMFHNFARPADKSK
jgi:hypothetical protein